MEGVVKLTKIMYSRLTTLYLPEKGQNFPLAKVKYNNIVLKSEEQPIVKWIQVQRKMQHRSFVCVLSSVSSTTVQLREECCAY